MGKELTVKNEMSLSKDLAKEIEAMGLGMGAGDNVSADDIMISKIHLAQPLTPMVMKKKASAGDYVDLSTNEVLGEEVEVIMIDRVELLQIYKLNEKGEKGDYITTVDFDKVLYASGEYENQKVKMDRVNRFFCLKVNDIKNGSAFPWSVDFKRTSSPAGRKLADKFFKMKSHGIPSYVKVFTLSSELVQDEFTYYVKKVDTGRDITKIELQAVALWLKELASNRDKYKVDESDVIEDDENTIQAESHEVDNNEF